MHKNKRKEKLKTNNKKKKIIVTTVTTAVVFITVGTGVYINHLIKISNYLSNAFCAEGRIYRAPQRKISDLE